MFRHLFVTPRRCITHSSKDIAYYSFKDGKRLITNPFHVFMAKNYPDSEDVRKSNIKRYLIKYFNLSPADRAKYTKIGKANLKLVNARKKILSQGRTTGCVLFQKANFQKFWKHTSGKQRHRLPQVNELVMKRWKALSAKTQKKYVQAAAAVRRQGRQQYERLIAKYKKAVERFYEN